MKVENMKDQINNTMFKRIALFFLILLSVGIFTSNAYAETVKSTHAVTIVEAIGITVADMDRSIEFYSKVLSFKPVSEMEVWGDNYDHFYGIFGLRIRVVRLQLGKEYIELTEYLTHKGKHIPPDSRSNDHWFQHMAIVVSDMERAYQHLRKYKVQHVSTAPQQIPDWNKAAAGIKAFYFQDPDGHNLEIIHFPPDKRNPRWQHYDDRLFLGIDHTAIVVSDTKTSLKFYRNILGMKVSAKNENYGTEQEHLNNVFGARLLITGLKADSGPGIEFLEYLTPKNGRPMPEDEQTNDLMHWQTTLRMSNIDPLVKRLRAFRARFISSGIIDVPDKKLTFGRGFLVRDPDGHTIQLISE
ncbi:MAG: VOC family protein [Planctomycetia bacterium]|nr:VOC family protein [Planctomycetia bacterium]